MKTTGSDMRRVAASLLAASLLLACPGPSQGTVAGHTDPAKVLVRVNGEAVTAGDILRRVRAERGVEIDPGAMGPTAWQRLVEEAAEREVLDLLLWQAARAEEAVPTGERVAVAIARSREMMGDEKFQAMLRQRGAGEEEYRRFLTRRLAVEEYRGRLVAGIEVSEERAREYFEAHPERFTIADSVRVEVMILEDRETALDVRRRLREGEDFSALAAEHSVGFDNGVGGPTRWLPYEALPSDVAPLAREAAKGTLLEPIESSDQVHLVRILDKRAAGPLSFDEVRGEIIDFLRRGEERRVLEEWLEQRKAVSVIEYLR